MVIWMSAANIVLIQPFHGDSLFCLCRKYDVPNNISKENLFMPLTGIICIKCISSCCNNIPIFVLILGSFFRCYYVET